MLLNIDDTHITALVNMLISEVNFQKDIAASEERFGERMLEVIANKDEEIAKLKAAVKELTPKPVKKKSASKRGRGRPKKVQAVSTAPTTAPMKRGRGRPRKNPK